MKGALVPVRRLGKRDVCCALPRYFNLPHRLSPLARKARAGDGLGGLSCNRIKGLLREGGALTCDRLTSGLASGLSRSRASYRLTRDRRVARITGWHLGPRVTILLSHPFELTPRSRLPSREGRQREGQNQALRTRTSGSRHVPFCRSLPEPPGAYPAFRQR